jgi:ubiquinone/menaquinone biosynthesis C-methylase UbiE
MFRRAPRLLSSGALSALIVMASMSGYGVENRYNIFIPYVPTPNHLVDRMLELAEIGKDDLVLDMGSGDGRIVITAAQRYGSRGRGVEIDPKLVEEAKENARKAGVAERTEFVAEDMFVTRIEDATVMTLYVLTASNLELRPRILKEMRPGSRVVSHQFSMGAWLADKHESLGNVELYMWFVPAPVGGTWRVQEGRREYTLKIEQEFQEISGTATIGNLTVPLRRARLKGNEIDFAIDLGDESPVVFRGHVTGGIMEPRAVTADSKRDWRGVRTTPPDSIAK